jgi:hypothetical protein
MQIQDKQRIILGNSCAKCGTSNPKAPQYTTTKHPSGEVQKTTYCDSCMPQSAVRAPKAEHSCPVCNAELHESPLLHLEHCPQTNRRCSNFHCDFIGTAETLKQHMATCPSKIKSCLSCGLAMTSAKGPHDCVSAITKEIHTATQSLDVERIERMAKQLAIVTAKTVLL